MLLFLSVDLEEAVREKTWREYTGEPTAVRTVSPGGLVNDVTFNPGTLFDVEDDTLLLPSSRFPLRVDRDLLKKLRDKSVWNES